MKKLFNFEPPLAWSQLSHQKVRFAVAITGVCFANILMFTQLGLLAMLTQGTTKLHRSLGGDLVIISSFAQSLQFRINFPRAYLFQAAAVDGVASANPVYIGRANWVNPKRLEKQQDILGKKKVLSLRELFGNEVRIIAINPAQPGILNIPLVNKQLAKIISADAVLYDQLAQSSLGDIPELFTQNQEVGTLMDNRRTYVVGLFSMGSTLFEKGNVVMSDWNYALRYGANSLKGAMIGVINLEKGANIKTVQAKLRATLPDDVVVLTPTELVERELQYQATEVNGVVLRFGTIVGFIIGVIIIYQVLYTDISEHLSEYATLKAMGYADRALLLIVLQEGVILAVLGFIPGFIASCGIYQLLVVLTRIPLVMQASVALQVFILTILMCSISGAIATNKLRSADPADVF
ncbi:FtsX-like permease family protein [Nostoc sp. FACHB-892]|uniref:ABC transporter permease DevC n=1 Tax=Nostoc sp. FACHB-892 TaxID=2692843 RepID=UPI00168441E5|nr:ABC transporter permease DevC [Nostoc sp. FACHB-892]MBD2730146.1 FtsX-like permease family protein [Nostoc sp. FACHB-892]